MYVQGRGIFYFFGSAWGFCFSLCQKIRYTKQCGEKKVQILVNAILKFSCYAITVT